MRTWGLTGGIGMGKSTAAGLLAERGIPVMDTDQIARDVVEPGQPALGEIIDRFGQDLVDQEGRLRRDRLAAIVFDDPPSREWLESVLHPRIRKMWEGWLEARRAAGAVVAVVVIPLLFETGAESTLDTTICLACTPTTQRERLRSRGWSESGLEARMAAQMPVAEKMRRADFVIWNEGSPQILQEQLQRILTLEGAFDGVSP